MTTTEVAEKLGITRQAVAQRVRSGALAPAFKVPTVNGGYLFDPAEVENAKGRYER